MSTKLPSRFAHGDKVSVNLQECGTLKNGEIQRIIFAEDKVSYDICFTIISRHGDDVLTSYPVFPDVDSAFVKPDIEEAGKGPWIEVLKKSPPDNKTVPGRYPEGEGEYKYASIAKEGSHVFVGEEERHDCRSKMLEGWEWLDETA